MPDLEPIREELETIAEQVKTLRAHREYSQAALARKARVARQTIFDLEQGDVKEPSLTTLKKVATALDVPVIELLDGSGRVIASTEGDEAQTKLLKIAKIIRPAKRK